MNTNYFDIFNYIICRETEGIDIRNIIILIIVAAIGIIIPGLTLHFFKGTSLRRVFHFFFIIVYLIVILSFTIFRRQAGSRTGIVHLDINLGFGLRGNGVSVWGGTYSFLNVLLFLLWGVLIYTFLVNKRLLNKILMSTIIGFVTSTFIELIQLLSGTGMFEISDIITNTSGTFLGAIFAVIAGYIFFMINRRGDR
jgi:glycopeptide antibiotics resistance protein